MCVPAVDAVLALDVPGPVRAEHHQVSDQTVRIEPDPKESGLLPRAPDRLRLGQGPRQGGTVFSGHPRQDLQLWLTTRLGLRGLHRSEQYTARGQLEAAGQPAHC